MSAERRSAARELVAYFDAHRDDGIDWLAAAARGYCDYDGDTADRLAMAAHIIGHPTMQDTPRNRADGYTPYTTPAALLSQIVRTMT